MKYPAFYDPLGGSWTEPLGVRGRPTHVLIDADGSVLATPGAGTRAVRLAEVEAYLAGRK